MKIAEGGFCGLVPYGLVIWFMGLDPDDRLLFESAVSRLRSKFGKNRDDCEVSEGGADPAGR